MVQTTRTLGFWTAFAIGLGTMIAAGIFSLSGQAVSVIGSNAVISFVIAAAVAGLTAGAYSEFASIYSESGGGYLFTSRTVDNDYVVYLEGVMLFLGYSATTAFYLTTMGEWVHAFILPSLAPWMAAIPVAVALGALNARGTEESGAFQIGVTAAKVAVLLVFIAGALLYKPPAATVETFVGGFDRGGPVDILRIAGLAFITFFGFSAIAASAGEIIEPRKTVPRAIAASIGTVTVLYTLVIVAMMNAPDRLADRVAEAGETAMGLVAMEFLGPIGMQLIIAGAIFSMVSASNASILAASRIGYLMGREGNAFRRFQRIHDRYGTPIWGVGACTFTIVALILVFDAVFPAEGAALAGVNLGLAGLTGFANLNLLVPLSVVNGALILSRYRSPEMERPFRVPGAPLTPALGIAANLALVASLPLSGVAAGVIGIAAFLVVYLAWGGALGVDEIMREVGAEEPAAEGAAFAEGDEEDRYRVLVPVAREEDAADLVHLADRLARLREEDAVIDVMYVERVPEQTPSDAADTDAMERRLAEIEDELADVDVEGALEVDGYVSQDVAFAILQVAREESADLILMGYPEEHRGVVETVQHRTPCDVLYGFGVAPATDFDVVNVGAGGGPNHLAMLPLVDAFGAAGSEIHVVRVEPEIGGTSERVDETVEALERTETIEVQNVEEKNVAKGLVDAAHENGGVLLIGASRDHLFRQWLFGSTPDRVVDIAAENGVPVLIYRGRATVTSAIQDAAFLVYRFFGFLRS